VEEISIRKYKKDDRPYLRDIAWQTAFMGKPADIFFQDQEILTDFLTLYFTDYEPESCFVAKAGNEVVGYLIGSKDTVTLRKVFKERIAAGLFIKALTKGTLLKKKNAIFLFRCLLNFLKDEFKEPDFSGEYPATLHINIKEGFRNLGAGSKLISAYLNYLKAEKVPGVYLATMSEAATKFFEGEGFDLLHKSLRSYFRYVLHKDITVYIYGKRL